MQQDTRFELRLAGDLVERIDRWRGAMPAIPSRSEAIRYLLRSRLDEIEKEEKLNADRG